VPRQLLVLNNLACTEHDAGQAERACAVAERLRELAGRHGLRLPDTSKGTTSASSS
jgi:hypothetical protein